MVTLWLWVEKKTIILEQFLDKKRKSDRISSEKRTPYSLEIMNKFELKYSLES